MSDDKAEDKKTPKSVTLPLGAFEFILATLDRNPAGAPVMEVAKLIGDIATQITAKPKDEATFVAPSMVAQT